MRIKPIVQMAARCRLESTENVLRSLKYGLFATPTGKCRRRFRLRAIDVVTGTTIKRRAQWRRMQDSTEKKKEIISVGLDTFKKYSEDTTYKRVSTRYFFKIHFGRYFCIYLLICTFMYLYNISIITKLVTLSTNFTMLFNDRLLILQQITELQVTYCFDLAAKLFTNNGFRYFS